MGKGAFGWIVADKPISHPESKKHGGKIYLAHEDVEDELSGVGANVSFFLYSDGNGLGAMNVKPASKVGGMTTALASKPKLGGMAPKLGGMATALKASAKKAAAKGAAAKKGGPNLKRVRLTEDP